MQQHSCTAAAALLLLLLLQLRPHCGAVTLCSHRLLNMHHTGHKPRVWIWPQQQQVADACVHCRVGFDLATAAAGC
jgi:hypothetical protein